MFKENYNVIGVMSGTSLDGVDLAYINFNISERWTFEIFQSETISYSDEWQNKLKNAIQFSASELEQLNNDYTKLLASIISEFISKHNLTDIDAVCSHGHTILHQPQNGLTLQIGNLPLLRDLLPYTIVYDFRVQDVALGGQGAPLVPIGDKLLFAEYDYCLNLGGFANVSYDYKNDRIAYDICPVNIVMNVLCNNVGLEYDNGGNIAKTGIINNDLLTELNSIYFYHMPLDTPKSLGKEWVVEFIFPILERYKISTPDLLATFCEHIAIQISQVLFFKPYGKMLVTGGGTYNAFLIERIKIHSQHNLIVPDKKSIEFKEALIFAFLGVLRIRNEINCLKSVTGASKDSSGGAVYFNLKYTH
jgi:anhydro-N-acetylmuramic acid kinase